MRGAEELFGKALERAMDLVESSFRMICLGYIPAYRG